MKRGTKMGNAWDASSQYGVKITKVRGKLTLDEITEALQYGERGQYNGRYAILINASESTVGGNGLWFDSEPSGDEVFLYPIVDSDDCPVCNKNVPPFEYCPNCGERWKDFTDEEEKKV